MLLLWSGLFFQITVSCKPVWAVHINYAWHNNNLKYIYHTNLFLSVCSTLKGYSLPQTHRAHLGDSRGDTVFDTLVYGVRQPLAAPLLQEGQEGLLKHRRGAEHHRGQGVIRVSQAQGGRQHRVIPANLCTWWECQRGTEATTTSIYTYLICCLKWNHFLHMIIFYWQVNRWMCWIVFFTLIAVKASH